MNEDKPRQKHARTYIQQTRRAQLTDCAIDVLAEVGYAQTSLVRIAERAHVSRGVITYHFADRDELIDACVTQVYDTARNILLPKMQSATTTVEAVRTFIVGSAEFYRDWPNQMAALHEIIVNARDADGRLRHPGQGEAYEQELSAVATLLEQGQQASELRQFPSRVMARTIRHALNGLLQDLRTIPGIDVIADAEAIADIFERAMTAESHR